MKKYNFTDRMYEIMAARGYTTQMLEERTGIGRRNFTRWVDGKYPSVDKVIIIADELGCSVAELLGVEDKLDKALKAALDDAKLSGCKTCKWSITYVENSPVCARQGGVHFPKENLACWEWRGLTQNKLKG